MDTLKDWQIKQNEYEIKKARAKALKLRLSCSICGEKAKLNCPCGTTQCAPGADINACERIRGGAPAPRDVVGSSSSFSRYLAGFATCRDLDRRSGASDGAALIVRTFAVV